MTMLGPKEFEAKKEELDTLARSIDIWKQATITSKQKQKVDALLERLQAETYELECAFLERKLAIFNDILAVYKNDK